MFDWFTALIFLLELVFRLFMVAVVLLRSPRPSTKLAWTFVILAIPVLGALAYLAFGEVRLGKRRVERHAEIVGRTRASAPADWVGSRYPKIATDYRPAAVLAEAVGGKPPRNGHAWRLFGKSDEMIASLVRDIDGATSHCHLLFYIYLDDDSGRLVAEALRRAEERGVECRVLVDAVGSRPFLGSRLCQAMRDAEIQVVAGLPASLMRAAFARVDLRNHRKLAVIDGKVAYTGSQNIADASFAPKPRYAPWVDVMMRVEGPVVRDLQELFVADWYLDTEEALDQVLETDPPLKEDGIPMQVVPTGPGYYNAALHQLNQATFHAAREEIILTTPYFAPAEADVDAMCSAARRGVRVSMIVPARNDSWLVAAASRSHYRTLLDAGVEIHEFTRGLLHAKTMTVDRAAALLTTANFDRRSFELNLEVSTIVYDSDFASQLRFLQHSYLRDARPVEHAKWRSVPWPRQVVHNAAGALSALL